MATIFSKFPHKALFLFSFILVVTILFFAVIDIGISFFLNQRLVVFQEELHRTSALRFGYQSVLFDIFSGVRISGLRISQANQRSEEHTSELQSPLLISYAVFCLDRKSVV